MPWICGSRFRGIYTPLPGEDALREAAWSARAVVHIDGKARKAGQPCVQLYRGALLGVFKSAAEARAFLQGGQHEQA